MNNWDSMTPKERKAYINQDQVSLREFIGPPYHMFSMEDGVWPNYSKNDYKIIYEMYFIDKKEVKDIIYHIKLSESQVYNIITKLKNNYVNHRNKKVRKILEMHFVDGIKVMKIAKIVGVAHSYVSKVISQYLAKNNIR